MFPRKVIAKNETEAKLNGDVSEVIESFSTRLRRSEEKLNSLEDHLEAIDTKFVEECLFLRVNLEMLLGISFAWVI